MLRSTYSTDAPPARLGASSSSVYYKLSGSDIALRLRVDEPDMGDDAWDSSELLGAGGDESENGLLAKRTGASRCC